MRKASLGRTLCNVGIGMLIVVWSLGPLSRSVSARESPAKLHKVKGEVTVHRSQMAMPGHDGFLLISDDTVKTADGRARILFNDGSVISLQRYTEIQVHQPKGRFLRSLKVFGGRLWARVRRTRNLKTEFQSGTVITAIRGTTLEYSYDPNTGAFEVGCTSGSITVNFMVGGEMVSVTITEGQKISFDPATQEPGTVPEPEPFESGEISGETIETEEEVFVIPTEPATGATEDTGQQGGGASPDSP